MANSELESLRVLGQDLLKLQEDMKNDVPTITHKYFKEEYLDLFMGRPKENGKTFHHWYDLIGHRTTYVNVVDEVDGKQQVVYQVPPTLNRNGLSVLLSSSKKSLSHLLAIARERSQRLPRRKETFIQDSLGQASIGTISEDTEATNAWIKLLKYNGESIGNLKITDADNDETELNIEHSSEEISWDEDSW